MQPGKDFIGLGGGVTLFNDKGEILLQKRSKNRKHQPGVWERPGGGIELGEKIEETLIREIQEETGVEIKALKFQGYVEHVEKGEHWIGFSFEAREYTGTPTNMEPELCDEINWFPLNDLPESMAPYTRDSLEKFHDING